MDITVDKHYESHPRIEVETQMQFKTGFKLSSSFRVSEVMPQNIDFNVFSWLCCYSELEKQINNVNETVAWSSRLEQ